jgi:hypothetical protein
MGMYSREYAGMNGNMRLLSLLVLACSLGACAYGIHATGLLAKSYWLDPWASAAVASGAFVAMLVLLPISRVFAFSYSMAVAGLFALTAAAFAGVGPVVAVVLSLASAFCIGRHLLGETSLADAYGSGFAFVLTTILGTAVLSFAVCVLSFFPVNNPATYLALLLAPVLFGLRRNAESMLSSLKDWHQTSTTDGRFWLPLTNAVIATALFLKLLAVLRPELGYDALATHLVVADQLRAHGSFHYDVTQSIWAVMPLASDWQIALVNMLSGEIGARLTNFSAELLICTVIFMSGRQIGNALAGVAAVVLYVCVPLTHLETTSVFTENFWTLWFLGALLTGLATLRVRDLRLVAASGFLLGTALAAKVITIFLAPFFLAIAAAWLLMPSKGFVRTISVFALAALVAGSIPYVNAWLTTGNPVFPFMNHYFQSPLFDTSTSFDNPKFKTAVDWRSLYDMTFDTGKYLESYPGGMGIGYLLFFPAALLYSLGRSWAFRIGAVCLVLFVAGVFHFQSYLRYILPVLPLAATAIGLLVAELAGRSQFMRVAVLSLLVASAGVGLFLTPATNHYYRSNSIPFFWGSDEQRDYVDLTRPEQGLTRAIDAFNFRRVLWLGSPYIAGTDADVYVVNWHGGHELASRFNGVTSAEAFQKIVADGNFDAIAVASDFNACQRPGICEFLDGKTNKVYSLGAAALYVPSVELLFDHEMLVNPNFDRPADGWGGEGRYVSAGGDGAVVVSALKSFSQAVPVTGKARYLLEVRGRCTADKADYRAQVNWLDRRGAFITTNITVIPCSAEYADHSLLVTAPEDAATAAVYASGHLPDLAAEITSVSFRQ